MQLNFRSLSLLYVAASSILLLTACGSDNSTAPADGQTGADQQGSDASDTAEYQITFDATWSATTHPVNFPGNPHFSPLVGAVHSEQSVFWQRGQIASPGVEQMAETGATSILLTEIQAVIGEGRALSTITGGGIGISPGSVTVQATVSKDFPHITLVSMLAPSPDWFIGVSGLSMLDESGDFKSDMMVDLLLLDSGTDAGPRYTSSNSDLLPRLPIDFVSSDPGDSDFVDGAPVVGSLRFAKAP